MKIESLVLLAEYFAEKREISFVLLVNHANGEEENPGHIIKMAVFLDDKYLLRKRPHRYEAEIENEINSIIPEKDFRVFVINGRSTLVRYYVTHCGKPVFCRNENRMFHFYSDVSKECRRKKITHRGEAFPVKQVYASWTSMHQS